MLAQVLLVAAAVAFTDPEGEPQRIVAARPVTFELHPVEQAVIEQTNQQREARGLPPLEIEPELMQSARQHAGWMTRRRSLQHTSKPVAENIAMGQRTVGEVIRSWMNSPGHRANILNRAYRRIGVAAYSTPDGTVYWCQQFLR